MANLLALGCDSFGYELPTFKIVLLRRVTLACFELIVLFCSVVYAQNAIAEDRCDLLLSDSQLKENGSHIKELLKQKKYAALEDEFKTKQDMVERGEYSDELLRLDFDAAFDSDPEIEPLVSEWAREYPASYAALVARAFYYVSSGYAKRGHEFVNETSREQLAAMERQFGLAAADLKTAISMTKKPTVAYAETIFLARASSSHGSARSFFRRANRRFPKSLAIKVTAAYAFNPKWGGSFEELDQLVAAASEAKMKPNEIAVLKYRVEMEKANFFEVITKQKRRAAAHYRLAGNICEAYWPWENVTRTSYDLEDWPSVIAAAGHLIQLDPTNGYAFQRRGWAYEKTDRMAEAVKDYEVAAEIGMPWAQNKLGWMLWQGIDVPKDVRRAEELFIKAAAQGNENAPANLRDLMAEEGNR